MRDGGGSSTEKGDAFESLLGWITQALEPGSTVTVKEPVYDVEAGYDRVMDVVVRTPNGGSTMVTYLEARDHVRPVPGEYIETVVTKHRAMGADRSAVASTAGFQRLAFQKAAHHGVHLYTFAAASAVDWMWLNRLPYEMSVLTWRLIDAKLRQYPPGVETTRNALILGEGDAEGWRAAFTQALLFAGVTPMELVDSSLPPETERTYLLPLPAPSPLGLRRMTGEVRAISSAAVRVSYVRYESDLGLTTHEFCEAGGASLMEVARGEITVDGKPLRVDIGATSTDGSASRDHLHIRLTTTIPLAREQMRRRAWGEGDTERQRTSG